MSKAVSIVLASSALFAVLFAGGGAGIYGSPFAPVPPGWPSASQVHRDQGFMLLTILSGPIACLAARLAVRTSSKAASLALIVGASSGAFLGTLTRFNLFWEKIFLIFVWLPMVIIALMLLVPRSTTAVRSFISAIFILMAAVCVGRMLMVDGRIPPEDRWASWTIDAVAGLTCLLGAGWLLWPRGKNRDPGECHEHTDKL